MVMDIKDIFFTDEEKRLSLAYSMRLSELTKEIAELKLNNPNDEQTLNNLLNEQEDVLNKNEELHTQASIKCYNTYKNNTDILIANIKEYISSIELQHYLDFVDYQNEIIKLSIEENKQDKVLAGELKPYLITGFKGFVFYIHSHCQYDNLLIGIYEIALQKNNNTLAEEIDRIANIYNELVEDKAAQFFEKPKSKPKFDKPIENLIDTTLPFTTAFNGKFDYELHKLVNKPFKIENDLIKGTNKGTVSSEELTVIVNNIKDLEHAYLDVYELQLLDILKSAATYSNVINDTLTITTSDIAKLRNITDIKSAREFLRKINELGSTVFQYQEINSKTKKATTATMALADTSYYDEGTGKAYFKFGESYAKYIIKRNSVIHIPKTIFQIDVKNHENSYFIMHKLCEHKFMNYGEKTEHIISVKTLLETSCPTIPTYEKVKSSNRAYTKRIINPFEKELEYLATTLNAIKWEYCHKNGKPLTDKELETFPYDTFINCNIKFDILDFPNQDRRLETKAQYIQIANEKKNAGKTKNTKKSKKQ